MDYILIGNSDYNREELEQNKWGWGNSSLDFLNEIREYESLGFEVKFETSLLRRIFGVTKYKVVGYRKYLPIKVRK